jgi:hypothetical protein
MMRPNAIPDHLNFPIPPARVHGALDGSRLTPAVASAYLAEVRRWRDAVTAAVAASDPAVAGVENLTPRARGRLAILLATAWDPRTRAWAEAAGYGLVPFPVTRPRPTPEEPARAVMDVLRWRAVVVDYLTDVWDRPGRPGLDMGECVAIGGFLRPTRLEGRCVYCLDEFEARRLDPDEHGCVLAGLARAG